MKIKFNKHFGFEAKIEDDDLVNGVEVMQLLASPGWKILEQYFDSIREELLTKGKLGVMFKNGEQRSDIAMAVLLGFDSFVNLPSQFVADINKKLESKREEREVMQSGQNDDD